MYTRLVASVRTRLIGAVLVLGLSGAPAVAAACATVCLSGMRHFVSAPTLPTGDEAASPAGHAHHHPAPAAPSFALALALASTAAIVPADAHACCPEAPTLVALSAGTVRADARALLAAPAVVPALLQPLPEQPVTLVACAPAAQPCRPRALLVLRI